MSRPTQLAKSKVIAISAAIVLLGVGAVWDVAVHHSAASQPVATSAKPTSATRLTYRGEEGKTALQLVKQHANVQTKSSSLGEYVTAINGNDGGGKKYWIFYVNGKESEIGAGAYTTHNNDVIQWKLQ